MREKLSLSPFWLSVMSQIFSALPTDVHRLPTGYQVPKRGCREPPGCRCAEPRLPPWGQDGQRGRGVWHPGEVPAAKPGGRGEPRHGLVVRGPAGEGGPGERGGAPGAAAGGGGTTCPAGAGRAGAPSQRSANRGSGGGSSDRSRRLLHPRQLTAVFSPRCKQVPPGRRQRRRGEPEGSSAMGPLRESKVRKARSVDAGGSARERWREREGDHCRARRARCELEGWRLERGKRGQEGGGEDGKRGTFAQVMRPGRWVGA